MATTDLTHHSTRQEIARGGSHTRFVGGWRVSVTLAGIRLSASEPAQQFPGLFHGSGAGGIGCRGWIFGVTRKWVPGAIGRREFI